jgi:hypothetical protein
VVMGGRRARRAADLMVGGAGSVGCGLVWFCDVWRLASSRTATVDLWFGGKQIM